MNFIADIIISSVRDNGKSYEIIEHNHNTGFIRVKELSSGIEFIITIEQRNSYDKHNKTIHCNGCRARDCYGCARSKESVYWY